MKSTKEKMVDAMLKAKGVPVKGSCAAECILKEAENMAQAALDVVLEELESEELKLTVSSSVTNLIHDDVIAENALKAAADRLRG